MAFFKTPGIERLYSGVTKITPFDFCSFSRNASQSAGGAASRSWLKKEMPPSVVTASLSAAGASLASAFATFSVKLSLRRLPTIATTWWGMGCPFSSRNRQLHLTRIARWMQVQGPSIFGNAVFAQFRRRKVLALSDELPKQRGDRNIAEGEDRRPQIGN